MTKVILLEGGDATYAADISPALAPFQVLLNAGTYISKLFKQLNGMNSLPLQHSALPSAYYTVSQHNRSPAFSSAKSH